jgi:hypothetical protein
MILLIVLVLCPQMIFADCATDLPPSLPASASYCLHPLFDVAGPLLLTTATLQFTYQSTNTILGNSYSVQFGSVPVGTPAGSCTGFGGFSGASSNYACTGGTTGSNRADCTGSVSWNWDTSDPTFIPTIKVTNLNTISTINWNTGASSNQVCWDPHLITTAVTTTTITPTTTTRALTTTPASSSSSWAGTYRVTSSCTTSCCCLTGTVPVIQSGTTVSVTSSLIGACGSAATGSQTFSIALSSSTSKTASFTFLGQSFSATISGNALTLTNIDFPQCSGTATRISQASLNAPLLVVIMMATLLVSSTLI